MNWLIFGDDWGRHPSTTQHLARALAEQDRVVWVNSLGMRAPSPSWGDLRAAATRVRGRFRASANLAPFPVVSAHAAPFHHSPVVRAANRVSLGRQLRRVLAQRGLEKPVALVSNPVAAWYLSELELAGAVYLRLDDYPRLPGVDPRLAHEAEREMARVATLQVGTAKALLGGPEWALLPQGVQLEHFARRRAAPSGRVLGFFGLYASWLDEALIAQVARRRPDWTLEFMGPVRDRISPAVKACPNVRFRDAVPFDSLPEATAHWSAAWIPFQLNPLTLAVNPLKAREYLASGLASFSTPLPEVVGLPEVRCGTTVDDVVRFLDSDDVRLDDETRRERRRLSVAADGWNNRAAQLREAFRLCTVEARQCAAKEQRVA